MDTPTIHVTRPENLPVPLRELETICFADLTKEQRAEFVKNHGCPKVKKAIEENEALGWYDQCHKTDWCKKMREEKEAEENAKAERLAVLEAREAVWLADARAKEKEFADYKAKTEERLNKLASLVSQLLAK
jgi:hypothetical protein